jgi:hypothetical protein
MPFAVAAVAGAAATAYSANRSAKAQRGATAAASEAAERADALSREQFDWNKWVYENDIAPSNKANQELQFMLAEDFLDTSRQQKEFAQEQRDEYRNTFLPVERKAAADAMGYDSEANVRRKSGEAAANVNQQFSNAIGQRTRALGRYGLSSSGGTGQLAKDTLAQAAAASGAATGAATATEDKAIALRAGAANFGRNMPNTSAQFFAGSNNSNVNASNASDASARATMPGANFMNNAYDSRVGGIGRSGTMLANARAGEAAMWGNVAQGLGQMTGSMWNQAGGWGGVKAGLGSLFSPASTGTPVRVDPNAFATGNTYGPGAPGGW